MRIMDKYILNKIDNYMRTHGTTYMDKYELAEAAAHIFSGGDCCNKDFYDENHNIKYFLVEMAQKYIP